MQKKCKSKRGSPKSVLGLLDLDHSQASVLQSPGISRLKTEIRLCQSMTSCVGTAQNLA